MRQTSFDFPLLDNYLDDDFLIFAENSKAFKFVSEFDKNNQNLPKIFAIFGDRASGKTHLAYIWQRKMGAEFLRIDNFDNIKISNQIEEGHAYIIENLEEIKNQKALFHIFNAIVEKNGFLLVTANSSLNHLKYHFDDVASRFKNIFSIEIKNPQIELTKMLLIKQFAIRQLFVEDKVIDYLAKNIDRNYGMIVQISKLLELYCFEQKQKITIPFISKILKI